jgi:ABC-type lipoprotein export system ATPase subunit
MPLVELRHVSKAYREPGGAESPVLKDVDLVIEAGDSVSIVGPSGCGKSTLLNILGTLDNADAGEYLFDGQAVRGASEEQIREIRSQKIGFIFQLHHLLPQCTVLENVLLPTLALPHQAGGMKERAMKLLAEVGLDHRAGHHPAQISGGERQRVAVVRALMNSPKLILADEPTGALDEANANTLTNLMVNLVEQSGIALVLVTHQTAQAERMKRMLHLHNGTLVKNA